MTWRIWLEELPPTKGWPQVVPAGWFGGASTAINRPLYMRTQDKEEAIVFHDEGDVVKEIMENRQHGYPCHAEPPITVTY